MPLLILVNVTLAAISVLVAAFLLVEWVGLEIKSEACMVPRLLLLGVASAATFVCGALELIIVGLTMTVYAMLACLTLMSVTVISAACKYGIKSLQILLSSAGEQGANQLRRLSSIELY